MNDDANGLNDDLKEGVELCVRKALHWAIRELHNAAKNSTLIVVKNPLEKWFCF